MLDGSLCFTSPSGFEAVEVIHEGSAAVAWGANKPLVVEEIEAERPKSGELLLEVKATGICHTTAFTLLEKTWKESSVRVIHF
jgi:D-arabinose 1-dehydrogenase-like Zn-dependent alcohol dehydrogenase